MVTFNPVTGQLMGDGVVETVRFMVDLATIFRDTSSQFEQDQSDEIYRVQSWEPKPEGVPGAICLATTYLNPGKIGDEYWMTRGHFHSNSDCPELETVISGEGALVMMDRDRHTWMEPMRPGTVHHVPAGTAHRVANTGSETLVFVSYWASETGHDYQSIRDRGFGARVRCIDNLAVLIVD